MAENQNNPRLSLIEESISTQASSNDWDDIDLKSVEEATDATDPRSMLSRKFISPIKNYAFDKLKLVFKEPESIPRIPNAVLRSAEHVERMQKFFTEARERDQPRRTFTNEVANTLSFGFTDRTSLRASSFNGVAETFRYLGRRTRSLLNPSNYQLFVQEENDVNNNNDEEEDEILLDDIMDTESAEVPEFTKAILESGDHEQIEMKEFSSNIVRSRPASPEVQVRRRTNTITSTFFEDYVRMID